MIRLIIEQTKIDDFYGVDRDIDIVKGVNKYPSKFKDFKERTRRIKSWQTK